METADVLIAGGSQVIRVVADAEGVTLSNGACQSSDLLGQH